MDRENGWGNAICAKSCDCSASLLMPPPPISFIYSHLFSCIALAQLFHFLPPPSPPSLCFAPSRFFLISFSLWVATKGWRSGSDVWMSSTNLPVKGEKKVTAQRRRGWGKHTGMMTASWRVVFLFLPPCSRNLKEFQRCNHMWLWPTLIHFIPSFFSFRVLLLTTFKCFCNLKLREMEVLGVRWRRRTALETRSGISEAERRRSSGAVYRSS